jgi:hypothetical protein
MNVSSGHVLSNAEPPDEVANTLATYDELRLVDVDALGQAAAPRRAPRCRCDRPQIHVDVDGDRVCIRCGRTARAAWTKRASVAELARRSR